MNGNNKLSQAELKNFITKIHNQDSAINYPSLYIYQGKNDKIANPKNADYLRDQWCGVHNIDTIIDKTSVNQLDSNVCIYYYNNSLQESKVVVYLVERLGHKLLINPGYEPHKGGKLGIYGKKSNFHSTYQIAIDFKIIP